MSSFYATNKWNRLRYSIYAPAYDFFLKRLSDKRKKSISLLELKPTDKVLIIGAGTGLDLPHLTEIKHLTAIDITPKMLLKLRQKAEDLNITVRADVMDAQKLEFENDSFDAVILHLILAVIPDPYSTLREAERVLKPGSKAVVFDKFLSAKKAGILRTVINSITSILATDINRRIEDIVSETTFKIVKDEPALLNGLFRYVLLRKP